MHYLATTGLSDIWELDKDLLVIGPWCVTSRANRKIAEQCNFTQVDSPYLSGKTIEESNKYCFEIYNRLIPELSKTMNVMHNTAYPERYWRVLLGPWLSHFIGVFFDRFRRVDNVLHLYPDFVSHSLPKDRSWYVFDSTQTFFDATMNCDQMNLTLFSYILNGLCPDKVKTLDLDQQKLPSVNSRGKTSYNFVANTLDRITLAEIILGEMYHLSRADKVKIILKSGCKIGFKDFKTDINGKGPIPLDWETRIQRIDTQAHNEFENLLVSAVFKYMPNCYVERYKMYEEAMRRYGHASVVGSAIGWYFNEPFKFYAAREAANGASIIDFQHGGNYGMTLAMPAEDLSLEKDVFYTWGWNRLNQKGTRSLSSPHLSKISSSKAKKCSNVLFIGTCMPRYHYRFHSLLQPDDMEQYFLDKQMFFSELPSTISDKITYRMSHDYGWNELERIQKISNKMSLSSSGQLTPIMKKSSLIIIDHPHTSFLEALALNIPTVLFWNHDVYQMRPEADEALQRLREVGILYKNPNDAAGKVRKVAEDPMNWWSGEDIQLARKEFCQKYAKHSSNWMNEWIAELSKT